MATFLAVAVAVILGSLTWLVASVYMKGQSMASIPRVPRRAGLLGLLLGNLQDLADFRYHRTGFKWTQQCGEIARLRVLWTQIVMVADPHIVTALLRDKTWDKSRRAYSVLDGLFDVKGHASLLTDTMTPKWRAVRKGVAQAFSPQNLREGFPNVRQVLYNVVDQLRQNGQEAAVDVDKLCSGAMWDAIGFVGFKTDMHASTHFNASGGKSSILSSIQAGMVEIDTRWTFPFRGSLFRHCWPGARQGHGDLLKVHVIIRDLLKKVRSYPPESLGNTIAGHLLRVKDPDTGLPLTDDLLVPEIGTMFIAGFETSSHTEAWSLYLISQHPEVEERILEELAANQLVPTPEHAARDIQYEDLARLTYLCCVIKEALRLYPVAPSTDRVAQQDMYVGGHFIPKGTSLWILLYAIQHSSEHWDDPETFNPERWRDPNCLYLKPRTQAQTPAKHAAQNASRKNRSFAHGSESDAAESAAESDSSWEEVQTPLPANSNIPVTPPRPMHTPSRDPQTPSDQPQVAQYQAQTPQDDSETQRDKSLTLEGQGTASQDQAKRFLAFSDGPRSCVGQPLAWINVTATLAVLLANFHFRLADKMGGPEEMAKRERVTITMAPAGGLWMHAEPRKFEL